MFPVSAVPTGLVLNLMRNPGTEVPGYFHRIPTGRKIGDGYVRPVRKRKLRKVGG